MLLHISEKRMRYLRILIASGWLLLILSLFFDPFSFLLTDPNNQTSFLHVHSDVCVAIQESCHYPHAYGLGAVVFWNLIVPIAVLILLVFGHEPWRRICPLGFLSQIPRLLGKQRQREKVNAKTGKVTYELIKIDPKSWIGRNHLYFQVGFLYVGMCLRLLFLNGDRIALGIWLLSTIAAAVTIGYLYAGKTWCQYFCPMAPVQKIFAEPGGIFTSKAHIQESGTVTQSMCRTIDDKGKVRSACVACQQMCMDIDAEKGYWETITQPKQRFLYYGYVGLVVGFFLYYYAYAGNWDYYFSGMWAREEHQIQSILQPGLYLAGHLVAIPKIVAVPLFLAFMGLLSYGVGVLLEKAYKTYLQLQKAALSPEQVQHRLYSVWTAIAFNVFFAFAGRSWIIHLPLWIQYTYDALLLLASLIWLYRMFHRSPERYSRERLASRLQQQLAKRGIVLPRLHRTRSLRQLEANDLQALAKTLPGYLPDQAESVYQSLMQELLQELDNSLISRLTFLQLSLYQETCTRMLALQLEVAEAQKSNSLQDVPALIKQAHVSPANRKPLNSAPPEQLAV